MSASILEAVLNVTTDTLASSIRETEAVAAYAANSNKTPVDIFFPVAKRPLTVLGKIEGNSLPVPNHMATVGMIDGEARILGVVGKDYAVIPTKHVVEQADAALRRIFGDAQVDSARIIDRTAFDGGFTTRTWDMPIQREIRAPRTLGEIVAFTVTVGNSYDGSSSVFLTGGTKALLCLNGMIGFNSSSATRKRHTKGTIGFTTNEGWNGAVGAAFESYEADIRQGQVWADFAMTEEDVVNRLIDAKVPVSRAAKILDVFRREVARRGSNAWTLANAVSHLATHGTIRDTGRDHAAATVLARQEEGRVLVGQLLRGIA